MIYDDKKFIGSVIRNARKKAGLTQARLSEIVDMTDKNLGNIEKGKQFPQVNNFLHLLEVLNLSVGDFGVKLEQQKNTTIKNEIMKKILSADEKKLNAYEIMINSVTKILDNETAITSSPKMRE